MGFTLLLINGCASKPHHQKESSHSFETNITRDGSKRFILSIIEAYREPSEKGQQRKEGGKGRGGPKDEGGRGGKRGEGYNNETRGGQSSASDEDNRLKILALLDDTLTQTEYCRFGYIELDYSHVQGKTEISGECQESASSEDKEKW